LWTDRMGKKKRKTEVEKPWCYYCNREFGSETTLVQHQKEKHFRCAECGRRFSNVHSMAVHQKQVHKVALER
jgi:transcription elongation factor Elf1